MKKHKRECRAICSRAGLWVSEVQHGGKHLRIITDHGVLIVSSTPGDRRRGPKQVRAKARRMARGW